MKFKNRYWIILIALASSCDSNNKTPVEDAGTPDADVEGPGDLSIVNFEQIPLSETTEQVVHLKFLPVPDNEEFITLSRDGWVRHYKLDEDAGQLLGKFHLTQTFVYSDCGLISLAFDPAFSSNKFLYLGLCFSTQETGVVRVVFDPPNYDAIDSTAVEIIRVGDENATKAWHNVGSMGFDNDGHMWVLFGNKAIGSTAQDLHSNLGKLLKIQPVLGPEGGYTVVATNPFVGMPERSPDIYAYGFRSPWTGVYDSQSRIWVGDVGGTKHEELNLVNDEHVGGNFGYAVGEGPLGDPAMVDPILSWPRTSEHEYSMEDIALESTTRRLVWVGLEYTASVVDRYADKLTNHIIYGDLCAGFVRATKVDEGGAVLEDKHIGHLPGASGWAEGPDGYIYAFTLGRCTGGGSYPPGAMYRVVLRE